MITFPAPGGIRGPPPRHLAPRVMLGVLHQKRERDEKMLSTATGERLRQLGLLTMATAWQAQIQDPAMTALSCEDRWGLLVDAEWMARMNRRTQRRVQSAHFRVSATPEDVDYTPERRLDRPLLARLFQGAWILEHHNVLITGPAGVGKTFLATAIGWAACRQGFSVRYYRLPMLLEDWALAQADGQSRALVRQLAHYAVLILDDWGLTPLSPTESRDMLELFDARYGQAATILTSQLPVEHWHGVMAEAMLADAILDRVVHNAYLLALQGESMRKQLSPTALGSPPPRPTTRP